MNIYCVGLVDSIYGNHSMENEDITFSVSPPGQIAQAAVGTDKSVTSPLSGKDQHVSLTPPNSPSISTNHSFLQTSANRDKDHKDKDKDHKDKDKDHKDKDKDKDSLANEAIDLQIDYWTIQPKLNDLSNKETKKSDNCKFTLKNCFRNLQISRLPMLGESSVSSLTLFYVTKEKKQKSKNFAFVEYILFLSNFHFFITVMRLGKKKEKENESKPQIVDGICRLVCSYKATQSPIKGMHNKY